VRRLVLVRHSQPEIVPGVPASGWHLSDTGRDRCRALAERLATYDLAVVVASREPKAVETGQIVARALGLPFEMAADLHEHERPNVGLLTDEEQFQARVVSVFEHPGELVFGCETGDEAHRRFAAAMANVIEQHPHGNLAIVAHGTVMTLFVARAAGLDPVPFWRRLGLPAFVVLSLPDLSLLEVVESVGRET
jgi:broad specificity phosphatase PhoE